MFFVQKCMRFLRKFQEHGTLFFVSHDTEFVTALSPDRVLSMPDGTLDYWSDDLAELVAMA